MNDLTGQTLGNYRIEALLGSGGMGRVYKATHVHLNRPAAVKVLHDQYAADPTFQARFQQEAKAASALRHPNIIVTKIAWRRIENPPSQGQHRNLGAC